MTTFEDLYRRFLGDAVRGDFSKTDAGEVDRYHLDCLLHPEKHAPVWRVGNCNCDKGECRCAAACLFDAIVRDEQGNVTLDAVKHADGLVYALIAPAFLGQFSQEVTPGKLRAAFKALGFDGMIEVALFADVLTLKEALEFDRNINSEEDFQLTSCCCPMLIAMIRKVYHELMPHVPGSVSPMIAAGRMVKKLHPNALTIFIGPCLAKKAEAREPDLKGAVDYVLTFQEVADIFEAAGIRPEEMEESERDHSSRAGRIYARVGGVSEAVRATVERLNPERPIRIKTRQADGVPACKAMIEALRRGERDANFFEGMGCVGGCVGGPMVMIDAKKGAANVDRYGEEAAYPTPLDNPYVLELLRRLGFHTVEDLLETGDLFTRTFD